MHTHTRILSETNIALDTHPRYSAGLCRHSSLHNPPSPMVEDWSAKVAQSWRHLELYIDVQTGVTGEEKLRALQRGNSAEMCLWLCVREREREREIMRLRKGQMFREVCRWSAFNLLCPCILAELVKMPILGVLEWGPRFCISNKRATLLISGPRFELKGPKSPPLQRSSKKITCLNFVF